MKITMCYSGVLAAAAGASEEEIDIAEDMTLESLLRQVTDTHGRDVARHLFNEQGNIQTGLLVVVGDRQVDRAAPLDLVEGARVTLLTPISGGSDGAAE